MNENTYKRFIKDLIPLLKQDLESAFSEHKMNGGKSDFLAGRIFSLYCVLDLIRSQADVYEIGLDEIGLDKYELVHFLYDVAKKNTEK